MYTACIFDLDGTLLDTIQDIADALNGALAEKQLPPYATDQVRDMLGYGVRRLIEAAIPDGPGTNTWIETVQKEYVDRYTRGCMNKTKPYPGIPALLADLRAKGVALMVLSNKSEIHTTRMIAHFFPDIPFLAVAGGRPDRPLKPDPTAVRELLSRFALNPGRTLFVGDSGVDIETAQKAGLPSVGVTWGYRDRAELEKAGADYMVGQASDILSIVLK